MALVATFLAMFWLALIGLTRASSLEASCPADNATLFALTYGFPLLAFQEFVTPFLGTFLVNRVTGAKNLVTPSDHGAFRPNDDTLYSIGIYDISHDDLEVSISTPPGIGRYFNIQFNDIYGSNFLNIGALTNSTPGKYIMTPTPSANLSGTLSSIAPAGYVGTIYSPSTYGILLYRVLVRNSSDLSVAREIQAQFLIRPIQRREPSSGPALTIAAFSNLSPSLPEQILQLTARFTEAIPYGNTKILPAEVTSQLALAGIHRGTYNRPKCVNLAVDYSKLERSLAAQDETQIKLGNYWKMYNTSLAGTYGSDYLARAYVAETGGFLTPVPRNSIYLAPRLNLSLNANESLTLAFSSKPPIGQLGFWSITTYSLEGYLVANAIDRYSLGDRSNLTYPNETLVYTPGGQELSPPVTPGEEKDQFYILVQAASPPANWTSNWLPSPAVPFVLEGRLFDPTEAALNGTYVYPLVTKGAAITT